LPLDLFHQAVIDSAAAPAADKVFKAIGIEISIGLNSANSKSRSGLDPRLTNKTWKHVLHLDMRLQPIAIFLVAIVKIAIDT
jgi:hypothetical protein